MTDDMPDLFQPGSSFVPSQTALRPPSVPTGPVPRTPMTVPRGPGLTYSGYPMSHFPGSAITTPGYPGTSGARFPSALPPGQAMAPSQFVPYSALAQHSSSTTPGYPSSIAAVRRKKDEESDQSDESGEEIDESQLDLKAKQVQQAKIIKQFTPEQTERFGAYKRSAFTKGAIKKYMNIVSGCKVNHNTVIVMAGITKIFVGEIIEAAKEIMDEYGETGPIRPEHLREAYQRVKVEGKMLYSKKQKRLFHFK
eukprot:TRINITY_DN10687_c0_g1_i1.p1 TRINITY_DN10687_c0_g1~~TRINITY_DN10687_c0_g1_i1.p1  ORF type:complete len:252 (-),score=72.27 TRINITY_DN10687_c0_g1_i1:171-926(-)